MVVVGDKPGPEFAWVGDPVFNADGNQVAYRARRRLKRLIIAAGREGPEFDWVSRPVFSTDGSQVAYAAAHGRKLWLKVLSLR